jgi:iron(III) transport system ATP-binding protein
VTNPEDPGTPPALRCDGLSKSFGDVLAVHDLSLAVAPGSLVALLGPSGCGKTTALRLIAGFESADAGTVQIAGRTVVGPNRMIPPERRRVGMVFQDYALFPHLTVAGNVRYGLTTTGASTNDASSPPHPLTTRVRQWIQDRWQSRPVLGMSDEIRQSVDDALDHVGLRHMAHRYPHELSGGEAQRVAIARALAPRPDVILLDEPFSNLDARLRTAVRLEVRQILKSAGAAAVFVTHDQEEAFSLADQVAVMLHGHIEQVASPQELYQFPASHAVAEFVGDADFLPGRFEAGAVRTELGLINPSASSTDSLPSPASPPADGAVDVLLRPESLRVELASATINNVDNVDNPIAVVIDRQYYGHDQVIAVQLPSSKIVHVRLGPTEQFVPGDQVRVHVDGPATVLRQPSDNT